MMRNVIEWYELKRKEIPYEKGNEEWQKKREEKYEEIEILNKVEDTIEDMEEEIKNEKVERDNTEVGKVEMEEKNNEEGEMIFEDKEKEERVLVIQILDNSGSNEIGELITMEMDKDEKRSRETMKGVMRKGEEEEKEEKMKGEDEKETKLIIREKSKKLEEEEKKQLKEEWSSREQIVGKGDGEEKGKMEKERRDKG